MKHKSVIAINVILVISLLAILMVMVKRHDTDNSTQVKVCTPRACHKRAQVILSNLNTRVGPCEDFYDYACGRFGKNYPLQRGQTARSATSELRKTVYSRVKELLYNIDEKREKVPPIRFAKIFLNQCMDGELTAMHIIVI